MDELTIDERKYISSKRAAEITGYAKDYVGQLCRGGYVPGRRIGRNWYVLESAIKDHRFGVTSSESPKPATAIPETREAPRYTALDTELSEPANLLGRSPAAIYSASPPADASGPPQGDFQEAWQAWFEMFRGRENSVVNMDVSQVLAEPESVPLQILTHEVSQRPSDISVLHTRHTPAQQVGRYGAPRPMPRVAGRAGKSRLIMQIIIIFLTLTLAGAAVLSTGFFDKTVASYERAQLLSGVLQYDK
ncbi:MAG: helix-turn-helix domain-containing protein [bacterium]|nr:helix-turn-helix domain-containing protein [bacterium]